MARGLAYDSPEGRGLAGAITATMTGEAYAQSARVARRVGPFAAYHANRDPFLRVIGKHRDAVAGIEALDSVPAALRDAAHGAWDEALRLGRRYGYRNAQATVLAPTGTIAFMMDCDTTGVEPDIALVKYKNLSGGGYMKIVNRTVPAALARLGYDAAGRDRIVAHIDGQGTIEGAPGLDEAHLPIFDCAFKAANGERSIEPMGHVRMMGAAQPFLSGANLEDRQRARGRQRRRDHADLHRRLEAGRQGRRHLPRQLQTHPAPRDHPARRWGQARRRRRTRRLRRHRPCPPAPLHQPTSPRSSTRP